MTGEPVTCPFCESGDVAMVAPWAGQLITSQWRCAACNSYFEAIRAELDGPAGAPAPRTTRDRGAPAA